MPTPKSRPKDKVQRAIAISGDLSSPSGLLSWEVPLLAPILASFVSKAGDVATERHERRRHDGRRSA
jgi:hypothetical protein